MPLRRGQPRAELLGRGAEGAPLRRPGGASWPSCDDTCRRSRRPVPSNKGRRSRLNQAIAYLDKRLPQMNYQELLKRDLEIATGIVEGPSRTSSVLASTSAAAGGSGSGRGAPATPLHRAQWPLGLVHPVGHDQDVEALRRGARIRVQQTSPMATTHRRGQGNHFLSQWATPRDAESPSAEAAGPAGMKAGAAGRTLVAGLVWSASALEQGDAETQSRSAVTESRAVDGPLRRRRQGRIKAPPPLEWRRQRSWGGGLGSATGPCRGPAAAARVGAEGGAGRRRRPGTAGPLKSESRA